ncbi:MAG: hypothetical protein J2P23_00700 [Microlunatus sp.]|nr:hypothetical protein [Microlunatus sp.]
MNKIKEARDSGAQICSFSAKSRNELTRLAHRAPATKQRRQAECRQ